MTTNFAEHDFRSLEVAAGQGDAEKTRDEFHKLLAAAPDQKSFLYEHSLPVHEKRHQFDTLSTSFGIATFIRRFLLALEFEKLLYESAERGGRLKIPFSRWVRLADRPEGLESWLALHGDYKAVMRMSEAGREAPEIKVPPELFPRRSFSAIDPARPHIPCSGHLKGNKLLMFELNALPILEGLAVCMQHRAISRLDASFAQNWKNEIDLLPGWWYYTSALDLALESCGNDTDQALRMLEFALLTPIGYRKGSVAEEEHPGWRFTAMAKHLLNRREPKDVDTLADFICNEKGWRGVRENVAQAKSFVDRVIERIEAPETDSEFFKPVLEDFRRLSSPLLEARLDSPLLGSQYPAKVGTFLMPPIHRKRRPDGTPEIFCDSETSEAWARYLLRNSVMTDATSGTRLRCPLSVSGKQGIPGDRDCDCDARTAPGTCRLVQMIESLNLEIVPL